MPNWTTNILKITGDADKTSVFLDRVASKDAPFDFGKIKPMPETLKIVSGSDDDLAIIAALLDEGADITLESEFKNMQSMPGFYSKERINQLRAKVEEKRQEENAMEGREVVFDAITSPETYIELLRWGRVYVDNFRKYGCKNWYEWCNENWGTKWNACDVDIARDETGTTEIRFDTAWSPPDGIMDAIPGLISDLPGVSVLWKWAEEQGYYGGIVEMNADGIVRSDEFEADDNAYDLCEEILGYSQRDYEDEEEGDSEGGSDGKDR